MKASAPAPFPGLHGWEIVQLGRTPVVLLLARVMGIQALLYHKQKP